MVEGTGLENRRPERVLEFESLRFRQIQKNPAIEVSRDFFVLSGVFLSGLGFVAEPAHHIFGVMCAIQQRLWLHPAIIDFFCRESPQLLITFRNIQTLIFFVTERFATANDNGMQHQTFCLLYFIKANILTPAACRCWSF